MGLIIGIVGSRRRNAPHDFMMLKRRLKQKIIKRDRRIKLCDRIDKIVTGDCEEGGDKWARLTAKDLKIKCDVKFKLDLFTGEKWEKYDKEGHIIEVSYDEFTRMCYARNEEIAKEKLDYLFCLVARDRTGGTEHTIEMFKKHHYDWEEKLILV